MTMNNPTAPTPLPAGTHEVRVQIHTYDWGKNLDPDAVLAARITASQTSCRRGCQYLNPVYTVTSAEPSPAYFRKIYEANVRWARECQAHPLEDSKRAQYRNVRLSLGDFGRFFSEGRLLPRPVWQAMAEDHKSSPWASKHPRTWRNPDLDSLASSADPSPLRASVLQELGRLLATTPGLTAYVTPGFTVIKSNAPDELIAHRPDDFLEHARQCQRLWKNWFDEILGKGRRKELKFAADLATLVTVYIGILVFDGRIYLPGLWPDNKVTEKRLLDTPFQSPTVPPEYLGLESLP